MVVAARKSKSVRLIEVATMPAGSQVDREAGIVRGVKVLGTQSANGRRYTETAMKGAGSLYEGARVNINHHRGSGDRPYQERFGFLENVRFEKSGLYADLRFNPKHALAEQFAWDAENAPGNVGLSHDAEGKTRQEGGTTLVEEITRVHSVDLVSDPASVKGLYESRWLHEAVTNPSELIVTDPNALPDDGKPDSTDLFLKGFNDEILKLVNNADDIPRTLKRIEELLVKRSELLNVLDRRGDVSDEERAEAEAEDQERQKAQDKVSYDGLPAMESADVRRALGLHVPADPYFGRQFREVPMTGQLPNQSQLESPRSTGGERGEEDLREFANQFADDGWHESADRESSSPVAAPKSKDEFAKLFRE